MAHDIRELMRMRGYDPDGFEMPIPPQSSSLWQSVKDCWMILRGKAEAVRWPHQY